MPNIIHKRFEMYKIKVKNWQKQNILYRSKRQHGLDTQQIITSWLFQSLQNFDMFQIDK